MNGQSPSDVVSHDVTQTCSYTRWASKEILCDRNYMEVGHFTLIIPLCVCGVLKKNNKALFFFFLKKVSNHMAIPVPQAEAKGHTQEDDSKLNAIPDVRLSFILQLPRCKICRPLQCKKWAWLLSQTLPSRHLVKHMVSGRWRFTLQSRCQWCWGRLNRLATVPWRRQAAWLWEARIIQQRLIQRT